MSSMEQYFARPVQLVDRTTIWRDGEVVKVDWRHQTRVLRINPLDPVEVSEEEPVDL